MVTMLKGYTTGGERVVLIPTEQIRSNRLHPRFDFNDNALLCLADSIHRHGILTPLTVRRAEEGGVYELISGERRLRAAMILQMKELPCIVLERDDRMAAELALVENLQRESLNMFEQARMIESLVREYALTQEEAAHRLSCSQSCIANKLRLLRLTPEEQRLILTHSLTERHARALLRIADPDERLSAARHIAAEDMNVSTCESYIESVVSARAQTSVRLKSNSPVWAVKDLRFFYNSINRTIESFRRFGVAVESEQTENESGIKIVIRLPKPGA